MSLFFKKKILFIQQSLIFGEYIVNALIEKSTKLLLWEGKTDLPPQPGKMESGSLMHS